MAQGQATVKPQTNVAEVPPHEARTPRKDADKYKTLSGFEGREDELGRSMSILLKMLGNHAGYAHEMNDPLVKAHLLAIQFAKNKGQLAEYVAHDIKTMMPINLRMKQIIEKTGNREIALIAPLRPDGLPLRPGADLLRRGPQRAAGRSPSAMC